ncbi:hypothetical protein GNX71_11910 [Variovorax sp. RKNM96]|nr:hypothetical protein GNX71_11910 [Variovorax sp. RKNM96]
MTTPTAGQPTSPSSDGAANTGVVPGQPDSGLAQPPVVSKPGILFASIPGAASILSFQTQNPAPGTTLQAKVITDIPGFLGKALAYDEANDRLYASTGSDILVFDKASTLNGTAAPSRTIRTRDTGIVSPSFSNLVLDKAADTLYLTGSAQYQDMLAIIGNASTANGDVTPAHLYGMASGSRGFAVDTQRKLIYGLGATVGIFVFDLTTLKEIQGPPTASININQAVRVISLPGSFGMFGVALDPARDRLYVAEFGGLRVVDAASTSSGSVPFQSFTIPAQSTTFDSAHDRLYVGAMNAAYIINDASTLKNGATIPATVVLRSSQNSYPVGGFAFP